MDGINVELEDVKERSRAVSSGHLTGEPPLVFGEILFPHTLRPVPEDPATSTYTPSSD